MCLLEDGKVILVDVPYYSPDWPKPVYTHLITLNSNSPDFVERKPRVPNSAHNWGGLCPAEDLAAEVRRQGPGGLSHILLTHDDFAPGLHGSSKQDLN